MKYEKKVFRERLEISARVVETIVHPIFLTATHRIITSGIQWEISPISGGEMHVYDRFQWPASVSKLARINKIPTDTRRLALIPAFSHRLLHLCWGFQSSEAWRSGPPSVSSCDWQDLRGVPIQHAWKRYGDPKCVRQGGAHGADFVGTQHWQGRYMGRHADQRRNISSIPGMRPT